MQIFFIRRVFVSKWNVGGIPPNNDPNLDDFLQVRDESDIYVLGYVPGMGKKYIYLFYLKKHTELISCCLLAPWDE